MGGDGVYRQYAVKMDATFLDEVLQARASPNPRLERLAPLGSVDVTAMLMDGAEPVFNVSSMKVGTVIDTVPLNGKDVSTEFTASWIERSHGGAAFESTGKKVTAAKCLAVLESLSCAERGNAQLAVTGYAYSADGTTHPLAEGTALPSGSPAVQELYSLGQVTLAGTPVELPQNVAVNFGNKVERITKSHHTYPTMAHIIGPRLGDITIRCRDLGELSDTRLVGSEVAVVVNLLKKSVTGGSWAGSGDRSITATKAYVYAQESGPEGITLGCQVRKEGANALFIFG